MHIYIYTYGYVYTYMYIHIHRYIFALKSSNDASSLFMYIHINFTISGCRDDESLTSKIFLNLSDADMSVFHIIQITAYPFPTYV